VELWLLLLLWCEALEGLQASSMQARKLEQCQARRLQHLHSRTCCLAGVRQGLILLLLLLLLLLLMPRLLLLSLLLQRGLCDRHALGQLQHG
jgi:hypothetical protein